MKKEKTQKPETEQLRSLIIKDFSLDKDNAISIAHSEKDLLESITKVVAYLIDKDFNRLLNVLYRIDVDEKVVRKVFASEKPVAQELAREILLRQKRKIQFRAKYGKNNQAHP